eukprot:403330684
MQTQSFTGQGNSNSLITSPTNQTTQVTSPHIGQNSNRSQTFNNAIKKPSTQNSSRQNSKNKPTSQQKQKMINNQQTFKNKLNEQMEKILSIDNIENQSMNAHPSFIRINIQDDRNIYSQQQGLQTMKHAHQQQHQMKFTPKNKARDSRKTVYAYGPPQTNMNTSITERQSSTVFNANSILTVDRESAQNRIYCINEINGNQSNKNGDKNRQSNSNSTSRTKSKPKVHISTQQLGMTSPKSPIQIEEGMKNQTVNISQFLSHSTTFDRTIGRGSTTTNTTMFGTTTGIQNSKEFSLASKDTKKQKTILSSSPGITNIGQVQNKSNNHVSLLQSPITNNQNVKIIHSSKTTQKQIQQNKNANVIHNDKSIVNFGSRKSSIQSQSLNNQLFKDTSRSSVKMKSLINNNQPKNKKEKVNPICKLSVSEIASGFNTVNSTRTSLVKKQPISFSQANSPQVTRGNTNDQKSQSKIQALTGSSEQNKQFVNMSMTLKNISQYLKVNLSHSYTQDHLDQSSLGAQPISCRLDKDQVSKKYTNEMSNHSRDNSQLKIQLLTREEQDQQILGNLQNSQRDEDLLESLIRNQYSNNDNPSQQAPKEFQAHQSPNISRINMIVEMSQSQVYDDSQLLQESNSSESLSPQSINDRGSELGSDYQTWTASKSRIVKEHDMLMQLSSSSPIQKQKLLQNTYQLQSPDSSGRRKRADRIKVSDCDKIDQVMRSSIGQKFQKNNQQHKQLFPQYQKSHTSQTIQNDTTVKNVNLPYPLMQQQPDKNVQRLQKSQTSQAPKMSRLDYVCQKMPEHLMQSILSQQSSICDQESNNNQRQILIQQDRVDSTSQMIHTDCYDDQGEPIIQLIQCQLSPETFATDSLKKSLYLNFQNDDHNMNFNSNSNLRSKISFKMNPLEIQQNNELFDRVDEFSPSENLRNRITLPAEKSPHHHYNNDYVNSFSRSPSQMGNHYDAGYFNSTLSNGQNKDKQMDYLKLPYMLKHKKSSSTSLNHYTAGLHKDAGTAGLHGQYKYSQFRSKTNTPDQQQRRRSLQSPKTNQFDSFVSGNTNSNQLNYNRAYGQTYTSQFFANQFGLFGNTLKHDNASKQNNDSNNQNMKDWEKEAHKYFDQSREKDTQIMGLKEENLKLRTMLNYLLQSKLSKEL